MSAIPPLGHRVVLHLDMDAFFAAIEERDHPEFLGYPLVVGADPKGGQGRGVVSTASYEARTYGIHSAQPISQAWRLCKEAHARGKKSCIFFRGNFERYARESERIMAIFRSEAVSFEQTSVDEAYFTLPIHKRQETQRYDAAARCARQLKKTVKKSTGLICSIGVGPNKLVAKIASDYQKPDGLTVVPPAAVQHFLDPLPVRAIPGIGPKAARVLHTMNAVLIRDLRKIPVEMLTERFGVFGKEMSERAHGRDGRSVKEDYTIKSIGREHTFSDDVHDPVILMNAIRKLAKKIGEDVANEAMRFRSVELKVRFSNFETRTRRFTLDAHRSDENTIARVSMQLFLPFLDSRENTKKRAIRLVGVRVGTLGKR